MGQRVEYEALLGSRYDQYIMKLRLVLGFLSGPEGSDFKAFRTFLRKNGLWDKEKSVIAFSLVGITWDKKVLNKVGGIARKIESSGSDPDARDILFEHLKDQNILLVKYVLEALDVESGGRLHSVHELYRMVTSYVFPGDYITLPCFQAWIEWMAATGYIKMVGIRWALSEKGLEAVGELKAMDIEEILEDMEEAEAAGGDADGGDAADDWGVPDAPGPTPAEAPEPAESAAAPADGEDEWWEEPPEARPPTPEDIEAAEASFMEQFADVADEEEEPAAAPPPSASPSGETAAPAAGLHQPLPPTGTVFMPRAIHHGADARALADQIVAWWNILGDWPVLTAPELGVEEPTSSGPETVLIELAAIAISIEGLGPQPQIFAFVQSLRDADYFHTLQKAKSGPQVLGALDSLADEPWMRGLRERLVHMSAIHQRLSANPGVLEKLEKVASGREAVLLLRDSVFGEAWVEAPFWTLRELVRMGLVENEAARSAAVVPTARLLENAARIGLIGRPNAVSFDELIAAAEATAVLFGPDSGYGEALEVMDRALRLGA